MIRSDGDLHNSISTNVDSQIEIIRADVGTAKTVKIALPREFDYKGDIQPLLLDELTVQPIKTGHETTVRLGIDTIGGPGEEVSV